MEGAVDEHWQVLPNEQVLPYAKSGCMSRCSPNSLASREKKTACRYMRSGMPFPLCVSRLPARPFTRPPIHFAAKSATGSLRKSILFIEGDLDEETFGAHVFDRGV